MSRPTQILQQQDTKIRYYRGVKYPEIPLNVNDIYVITTAGDRLDLLSNQYYKSPEYYWVISSANPEIPQNSLFIPEGTQIRIPYSLQNVLTLFNEVNLR